MNTRQTVMFSVMLISFSGMALAQAGQTGSTRPTPPASRGSAPPQPLTLNSIAPPSKIQFPPADPKNFNAQSPTTQEVNEFLKDLWGYDPNRVWQVSGIQSTKAPNVSRVTIQFAEQGVSHAPATTVFFVTPDGHHAIAAGDVIAFGARPFQDIRQTLEQRATGPYRGASSKDLMLVEFADLECPHCKDAAVTMEHLATDFPNARIVFENFPLTSVHPAAEKASEYAVCVAQQKGNAVFFKFVQAVFDNQAGLTSAPDQTLKDAATKAGADAAQVSSCASSPAAKAAVARSVKLGEDIGVDQTPLLFVNGRPVPAAGVPYATLKQIITYAGTEGNPMEASAGGNKVSARSAR